MNTSIIPDLILHNGRITTLDPNYPEATNLAIKDGRIVGVDDAEEYEHGPDTEVIDLKGRRVIPGLNDSHLHVIRGGLNYNMELRWDGVPSLADGLRMLKEQAQRHATPGQWSPRRGRLVSELQFAERRMPTLDEINAAAPNTPVFILHLYCRALLNQSRRSARVRLYQGHAKSAWWRNSTRRQRQSHRFAHRATERDHSILYATLYRQGAEAAPGASDEFHAPLHA